MNIVELHTKKLVEARAKCVRFEGDTLHVDLTDGRTISTPISWYPRLLHASPEERERWELLGGGYGIHWEDIDEDLSVPAMLLGWRGIEEQPPFRSFEIQPTQLSSSAARKNNTGDDAAPRRIRLDRPTPIKPSPSPNPGRHGGYRSATTGQFVQDRSAKHSSAVTKPGDKSGKPSRGKGPRSAK